MVGSVVPGGAMVVSVVPGGGAAAAADGRRERLGVRVLLVPHAGLWSRV
jgi:hypothetical protein